MNRATYIGHLALLRGRGGKSIKTGGLTLLTKVSFLLSGLQNLAIISTWPSEWHVLRSFCRAGDRRWEKRNRWTASPGKHRRAVYFYSIFFEGVKDTLMAGISLIQSDVDLSWSLIKKNTLEVRGFEPRTFRMRSGRSTTELHPRRVASKIEFAGAITP